MRGIEKLNTNLESSIPKHTYPTAAAKSGCITCLKNLVERGIEVNKHVNEKKSTALHYAALNGRVECVKLLLKNKANVNEKNGRGTNFWYPFLIVSKKVNAAVYYHWEGSRGEGGPVFHFYAMEMIYIDKKTDLIYKVEGVWSEKQFRDQFR